VVNQHIDELASSRRLVRVETGRYYHSPFRHRVAADHFHPNDRGYADIAHAFTDAVDGR
jgi:hypothetical protein